MSALGVCDRETSGRPHERQPGCINWTPLPPIVEQPDPYAADAPGSGLRTGKTHSAKDATVLRKVIE